jgi:hypothetical protein
MSPAKFFPNGGHTAITAPKTENPAIYRMERWLQQSKKDDPFTVLRIGEDDSSVAFGSKNSVL